MIHRVSGALLEGTAGLSLCKRHNRDVYTWLALVFRQDWAIH